MIKKQNKLVFGVLGFALVLSCAENVNLILKYKEALQVSTTCELKAHKNGIKTEQEITQKEQLNSFESDFIKDFNKKIQDSTKKDTE